MIVRRKPANIIMTVTINKQQSHLSEVIRNYRGSNHCIDVTSVVNS